MNEELPYDFDLLYDIKTMDEVERIAKGEPHCSNATYDKYRFVMVGRLGHEQGI